MRSLFALTLASRSKPAVGAIPTRAGMDDFEKAPNAASQWTDDLTCFAKRCKAAESTKLLDWI